MRVCMLGFTVYEADNRVRRYAETLAGRGDEVDFIGLSYRHIKPVTRLNGVRIYRLQEKRGDDPGQFGHLFRVLRFLAISMLVISLKELQHHYDVVHVHSPPDFEVFAAWLAKLRGSRIILDIHDLVPEFYEGKFKSKARFKRLLLWLERVSAAFSDHVIAANHLWEETLCRRSVRRDRCTTFLNYPDTAIFRRRGRRRNDNKLILIYPGSLNYHQGVDLAIRAFNRIKDQAPQAEFHIYGDGGWRPILEDLAAELGLSGRIRIRNPIDLSGIASVMENSDIGLVPKRPEGFGNEAFSTKILEFMSLGVPVIVADTMIDRYYFPDSVVAFFRGGDESALAACMLRLIQDPELRNGLAARAETFVKGFLWDVWRQVYVELVDRLTTGQAVAAESHSCTAQPARRDER